MKNKKISIIIPVKEINNYILESLPFLLKQSYENFEILIFPDGKIENDFKHKKIRIIKTGKMGPAKKRDLSLKYAKGEIFAFIDDDAYPKKDWLENALKNFENENVGAVGGPNLTPKENNKFQKTSGFVLGSFLVSGGVNYRYKKAKKREIEDFPSCNLFVRKNVFEKIGGFDSKYWPGEDTKLCLDIINSGKKIIYDPKVVVYHHRRKNLNSYLKQIFSYSKHRGYFAKKFPKTSLKISYFVPSFFLIYLILGPFLSLMNNFIMTIYYSILLLYTFLVFLVSFIGRLKGFSFFRNTYLILFTHMIYGAGFISGLLKQNLKSKLRE